MCTYYYEINNEKAPFDNPKVREALKLSLDRDIMVNKVKAQGDTRHLVSHHRLRMVCQPKSLSGSPI